MSNVIELAEKCGFTICSDTIFAKNEFGMICIDDKLKAFYDAAQKEQIEKDMEICGDMEDDYLLSDNSGSDHAACGCAVCKDLISNQLVKQND